MVEESGGPDGRMSRGDKHSTCYGGKDAERRPAVALQHLRCLVGSSLSPSASEQLM